MKLLSTLLCTSYLLVSASLFAQKNIRVASPDGNIVFSFKLSGTAPAYSVFYKGKTLIDYSALSLQFDNGRFEKNIRLNKPVFRDTTEDYELLLGKTKNVHTQYREAILPLEETVTPFRKINIAVKVFNDGLAFRYEFPQ